MWKGCNDKLERFLAERKGYIAKPERYIAKRKRYIAGRKRYLASDNDISLRNKRIALTIYRSIYRLR